MAAIEITNLVKTFGRSARHVMDTLAALNRDDGITVVVGVPARLRGNSGAWFSRAPGSSLVRIG